MDYEQKLTEARNSAARLSCKLASEKQSNIFLGLDITDKTEFERILDLCSDQIVGIKTHVDVIEGFDSAWWAQILDSCKDDGLVVFEDRKFADIGTTVKLQYSAGVYHIADWANLVTVHAVAGPGTLQGLQEVAEQKRDSLARGALVLAQMTSEGNLATGNYTRQAAKIAADAGDFCAGFIGNPSDPKGLRELKNLCAAGMLVFTPGIKLGQASGAIGQRYSTPKQAVTLGADFLIVASGICASSDPARAAREYRQAGWQALGLSVP